MVSACNILFFSIGDEPQRFGERHRWLTLRRYLDPGIAPSRLKAYIRRELEATEKVLPREPKIK